MEGYTAPSMRVLALDVGDRRTGVALSDETATLASPLTTLARIGPRKDLAAIRELVIRHQVSLIVVGLPLRLDGTVGPQAEKVQAFARSLEQSVRVPIVLRDERLTSVDAEERLRATGRTRRGRKAALDQAAAALILQGYLDEGGAAALHEPSAPLRRTGGSTPRVPPTLSPREPST